ncbi:hypothetical protein QVD17_31648 [Tagetes erecta]|uniref:Reverse transcriptase zinc-binding domain-containing protein n=1 Tax=Tagetes erecta TaxID=13708 RepID=A0AAD8NH90_TARER|nr:hypothetical protein QVD17_31648 [Tagetes erecta]
MGLTHLAESCKITKHEKACLENQHVFIPLAFDTFGFLATEAVKILDQGPASTWNSIAKLENALAHSDINMSRLIKCHVGSGSSIRFWIDTWASDRPFKDLFPDLFALESLASMRKLLQQPIVHINYTHQWKLLSGVNEETSTMTVGVNGIHLDSYMCPFCDDYEENAQHLLISCYVANMSKYNKKKTFRYLQLPASLPTPFAGVSLSDQPPLLIHQTVQAFISVSLRCRYSPLLENCKFVTVTGFSFSGTVNSLYGVISVVYRSEDI